MNRTIAIFAMTALLWACDTKQECKPPLGRWSDREGREWAFDADGRALWLTKFGSQYDTQTCSYKLDCSKIPATLIMENFDSGPFTGSTIQAIYEWSNDSTLRFQYDDAGKELVFDKENAIKLYHTTVSNGK